MFKIGDRVKIKSTSPFHNGKKGTIMDLTFMKRVYAIKLDGSNKTNMLDLFHKDTLELIENTDEIHITVKDNEVIAIHKQDGKQVNRTSAICHPNDTFAFKIGAELAFQRLLGLNKEFDWEAFKKGKVVVFCKDKEESEAFFKLVKEQDITNRISNLSDNNVGFHHNTQKHRLTWAHMGYFLSVMKDTPVIPFNQIKPTLCSLSAYSDQEILAEVEKNP